MGLAVVSNIECALTFGNQITNNTVCVDGNYNEGTCYVSRFDIKLKGNSKFYVYFRVIVVVLWLFV